MLVGCLVELQVVRSILTGNRVNENSHYCKIVGYDEQKECMELVLRGEDASVISLDCIYNCQVMDGEEHYFCDGMIRERYLENRGSVLIFQIDNGFYKKNLN